MLSHGHSDLTKTSTGFVLFYALQIPRLSMTFSMTLGLAVTFYKFLKFLCFRVFLDHTQFKRHKLCCPPKCVPFALFNHISLSCIVHALSSAVTNLPNKT